MLLRVSAFVTTVITVLSFAIAQALIYFDAVQVVAIQLEKILTNPEHGESPRPREHLMSLLDPQENP